MICICILPRGRLGVIRTHSHTRTHPKSTRDLLFRVVFFSRVVFFFESFFECVL
jgi:hypothetical protein